MWGAAHGVELGINCGREKKVTWTDGDSDDYNMLNWTRGTFVCAAGFSKMDVVRVSSRRKAEVCRKVWALIIDSDV